MEEDKIIETITPSEADKYVPAFEPAKEGEEIPRGIPTLKFNRAQRRALAKARKKNDAHTLQNLFPSSKELLKNPKFRQSLYKDLYEDFIVRKDKYVEAMKNDSSKENGTNESDE